MLHRLLRLVFLVLCMGAPALGQAQIKLQSGTYISSDGRMEVLVDMQADGTFILKAPNRTNRYVRQSGDVYQHAEMTNYQLRVVSPTKFTSFMAGGGNPFDFTLSRPGLTPPTAVAEHPQWQALYDKYKTKAQQAEGDEVQAWTFCAAVAYTRAHMANNQEVTDSYIEPIIVSLKQILVEPQTCPCSDVIPAALWSRFNP
ncbi:hypothetical protein F0P96_17150 [Hymenobacter busanensis]|uniref:Uncharacterized protein n=1 Tax=Hymenobacter busanensis TaxID=2607656 RepID=A0A7L4ZSB5_9BACT|nr:hypothetical protein [Hymenobacter busanensis]KAA9327702.1 hypothetical protein F0P96_17150 [Hymenobacter busanensis]QHJ05958.1 hypothetical protein GUY19_01080 [Hymenobacter busanensis]